MYGIVQCSCFILRVENIISNTTIRLAGESDGSNSWNLSSGISGDVYHHVMRKTYYLALPISVAVLVAVQIRKGFVMWLENVSLYESWRCFGNAASCSEFKRSASESDKGLYRRGLVKYSIGLLAIEMNQETKMPGPAT